MSNPPEGDREKIAREAAERVQAAITRATQGPPEIHTFVGRAEYTWPGRYTTVETEDLRAILAALTPVVGSDGGGLFDAIAHGDDAHRAWLKEAIEDYFAGRPVQAVVPSGLRSRDLSPTTGDALVGAPREGLQLVPIDPGSCELDDSFWLLVFMRELHANVPEGEQPNGWSDFTDAQRDRVKAAWRASLAALLSVGPLATTGDSEPEVNARKTSCKRGHALAGANLLVGPAGRRHCRTCTLVNQAAYRARRRAAKRQRSREEEP